MRGTIQKKGKKWYAVVYDGVNPETGNYRRRWVVGGPRKEDAERVLNQLVKRSHAGERVVGERITLEKYLTERWLPIQESRLRASTLDSYRRNIERHVVPALGSKFVDKLTVEDVDLFYAQLLVKGRRTKKGTTGLAPKTVHNIHVMLHKAMADAFRKGTVVRNVVALTDPPKLTARRREEIKAWEPEQLCEFLDEMEPDRLFPAYYLSAHTGMRRGEILGLRWKDVDFAARRISVRQALVSVAYEVQLSDVKTGTGRRTVDIEDGVIEVLEAWRATRTAERGDRKPGPTDLVFTKPDGAWVHPDRFSQVFDAVVAKVDVPVISLHDLRHTHATILLKAGTAVKVVSERLGHASPAFTMTVYQHVLPGMQAEAAAVFAEILKQARSHS